MENETLVHELLELMRQQQTQNTKIIESMMEAHAAQAQVFKSWLDMFKPSETPLKATSPEDRVKIQIVDDHAFFRVGIKAILAQERGTSAEQITDREAVDRVADLRVTEQAYVAAGQSVAFWT